MSPLLQAGISTPSLSDSDCEHVGSLYIWFACNAVSESIGTNVLPLGPTITKCTTSSDS